MLPESQNQEVLYLSYDGLTDTLGQSQILPYLIGLADAGHSITVLTFEKPHRLKKYRGDLEKICKKRKLHWLPLKYHKYPLILSTVWDLFFLWWTVKKILSKKQITILHCRSYLTSLIGLWVKRRSDIKFIFDMRGFWVDERVDGGLWNLDNPVFKLMYAFFKKKERQFAKEADHIVSLTENGRSEIQSWRVSRRPISVIPTCVDMDLFDPDNTAIDARQLRQALKIYHDDFVLAYLGSWGTWYQTDEMLAFFAALLTVKPESRLLLLTPDNPDLSAYAFASRVIVKSVSRNEVPSYLALANASICFIKPAFSKKGSSATKVAEALAMNVPVVTNGAWGDIDSLANSDLPVYICYGESDYVRIANLLIQREVSNDRQMLVGKFDLDSGVEKYDSIYRSLSLR